MMAVGMEGSHFYSSVSLFSLDSNSIRIVRMIIYDVYGLSPVCLRYLIQHYLSADTESNLSGSEVSSLRKVQEDLPDVLEGNEFDRLSRNTELV
jgi:hypothetical protein